MKPTTGKSYFIPNSESNRVQFQNITMECHTLKYTDCSANDRSSLNYEATWCWGLHRWNVISHFNLHI